MPFSFESTRLPEIVLVVPRRFADERGWFAETYKASEFSATGVSTTFVQDNESVSMAGTIRGLHYQLPPHAQGKLVRVVAGRVWDVAVDVRRVSPTFGRWVGFELSASNGNMLWIPPGFAHGFLAMEDNTHLVYKCTAEYHQASERAIRWDDPTLAIEWRRVPDLDGYRVSSKDGAAPLFVDAEVFG